MKSETKVNMSDNKSKVNMSDNKSKTNKKASMKKRNCRFNQEYPFPIVKSNCQNNRKDPNWNCMEGCLKENCVLVYDDASMKLLYTHGFYGKGTLSKYAPKICFEDETKKKDDQPKPQAIKPKVQVIEIDEENDEEEDEPKSKIRKVEEIVLSDSSMSDTERDFFPLRKIDIPEELTEKEKLQLTFEEAYFLSYGLGCLVVKDEKNQYISLPRLWNILCESVPDGSFPAMYAAYHHFRSKGWVVKSGMKYGVDYILYKDGPAFYHATYSVIVKPINFRNSKKSSNDRQLTWASLLSLSRVNNNTGKKLVFLYVTKPSNLSASQMSTPACISSFKIKAVLFKRWVPAGSRKETD